MQAASGQLQQIIIAILLLVIVAMGVVLQHFKSNLDSSERNYAQLTKHLDSKGGGTLLLTGEWINYNLKTFDGGRHWYAIKYDDEWGITIIGEAEEVYPGLLDHLDAWDSLSKRVAKRGPISLGDITEEDVQALQRLGFGVEQK